MRNKLMIIGMLALVPVAIAAVDLPESFYKQQEQIKLECSVALEDYYRVCCINFDENDDSMIREYLYDIRSSRDKFEEWARAHNVFGDDLKTLKCDFDKELQEVS